VIIPKVTLPLGIKKQVNRQEIAAMAEQTAAGQGQAIWWYCDSNQYVPYLTTAVCHKGIQEKEPRFDCQTCEDVTLCRRCAEASLHPQHKLKKATVPLGCKVMSPFITNALAAQRP